MHKISDTEMCVQADTEDDQTDELYARLHLCSLARVEHSSRYFWTMIELLVKMHVRLPIDSIQGHSGQSLSRKSRLTGVGYRAPLAPRSVDVINLKS
jgi:hypothetical protein